MNSLEIKFPLLHFIVQFIMVTIDDLIGPEAKKVFDDTPSDTPSTDVLTVLTPETPPGTSRGPSTPRRHHPKPPEN